MGGGNGQKSKMAREKNLEKMKGHKSGIFFFSFFNAHFGFINLFLSPKIMEYEIISSGFSI